MALNYNTVEHLNKGHFGTSKFVPCREVVLFSAVQIVLALYREIIINLGAGNSFLRREVCPLSKCPLSEGALYI